MNKVYLFPFILCRIAGESFSVYEKLKFREITGHLKKIKEERAVLEIEKEKLMAELYVRIGTEPDKIKKKKLIDLKRRVFEDKALTKDQEEFVLPSQSQYVILKKSIEHAKQYGQGLYESEIEQNRILFDQLLTDNLKNGFLFSSHALYDRVNQYLVKNTTPFKKKTIQVENGFFRYFSRITTKTSPLSTFTQLCIASAAEQPGHVIKIISTGGQPITRSIRTNNNVFRYLYDLLKEDNLFRSQLQVRQNKTIEIVSNDYRFLTNSNNLEAFQYIEITPILQFILQVTQTYVNHNELVNCLLDEVDADTVTIQQYIDELIQLGFLEIDLEISGMDPLWDEKMLTFLNSKIPGEFPELIDCMKAIVSGRNYLLQDNVDAKRKILDQTYQVLEKTCDALALRAGISLKDQKTKFQDFLKNYDKDIFKHTSYLEFHFKPEIIFFEDTAKKLSISFNKQLLENFVEKVNKFISRITIGSRLPREEALTEIYARHFSGEKQVNLSTFLEVFNAEMKNSDKDKQKKKSEYEMLKEKWSSLLIERIKRLDKKEHTLNLKDDFLKDLNEKIGLEPRQEKVSWAVLFQLDKETNNGISGVVNNILYGYGKYFSRFLHLFDEEVLLQLRNTNVVMMEQDIFAEISDASYFNANIHPSLMPFEINIPGGHQNLPPDQQIFISDMMIKLEDQEVILWHKFLNKRVYVFDLGFQGQLGRSRISQFLQRFFLNKDLEFKNIIDLINNTHTDTKTLYQVEIEPRIVYEDNIIIQRKGWIVPKKLLPIKETNETDWDFYLKVNTWRNQMQLPDRVFVKINFKRDLTDFSRRDNYKPQFIDFNNPFLVRIFEKDCAQAHGSVKIEEMLPDVEAMQKIDDSRFATEFLVQWKTKI